MTCGKLLISLALVAISVSYVTATMGTPSKLVYDQTGLLMVELRSPRSTNCILDTASSFSWLNTEDSVTVLTGARDFAWEQSSSSVRNVTMLDGSYYTINPGTAMEDIDIGGDVLVKAQVGGMVNTNLVASSRIVFSGGISIGLGRLAAGLSSHSVIDALQKSLGPACPFMVLPWAANNAQAGIAYSPGWYSAGLNAFNPAIFTSKIINWKVLPEIRTGATVTKFLSINVIEPKPKSLHDNHDDNNEDHPQEDLEKIWLPSIWSGKQGAKLILNLKDRLTLMPYNTFTKVLNRLLPSGRYTITPSGNGIYRVRVNSSADLPKNTLSFTLANGERLPISNERLFDAANGMSAGYKLEEMSTEQSALFQHFGPDAVYLGNAFIGDYALEHTLFCPVALRLRKFISDRT